MSEEERASRQAEEVLVTWWRQLDDRRGLRAQLRRARSAQEVVMCAGYHELRFELLGSQGALSELGQRHESLCSLIRVLAHVKEHDPNATLARRAGAPKEPGQEKARVSEVRFRRVMTCEERAQLADETLAVMGLLDARFDIIDFAYSVLFWGAQRRMRWADDYFTAVFGGGSKAESK